MAQNKFATSAAARKKGSIVRIEIYNYKLLLKAFLAERSQIVQLFQWLLRRRDNFRSCQTKKESSVRWIVLGSGCGRGRRGRGYGYQAPCPAPKAAAAPAKGRPR